VAYFVPDELTQKHLMDALARGVRVRLVHRSVKTFT
jgi:cardiolipin synthase